MEHFFTSLLTFIIIFYLISYLFRLAAPYLMKFFLKRMAKKADAQYGTNFSEDNNKDDKKNNQRRSWFSSSEVVLKPHLRQGQSISDLLGGEYINYDEVPEN